MNWSRTRVQPALAIVALLSLLVGAALATGTVGPRSTVSGPPVAREDLPVTATDHLRQPANNSPMLDVDPTDDRRLVLANRLDAPDFGCALNLSTDGGRSWVPTRPVPHLPEGAEKCYGPEVAFDRSGTVHFLFVGLHTKGNLPMGAFLTTSVDHGRTFSPPRRVLEGFNFGVRLAVDLATDRIQLVWIHANADPPLGGFPSGPNPVLAAHSDDGGATFSDPVQVSDPGRARVVAPALALGPGGAVHVAYYDLGGDARDYQGLAGPVWEGTWSVVVASSGDGGASFGTGVVVDDQIAPVERPALIFTMASPALVAGPDAVCAAWNDARHGDADILGRCSPTAGRTWSEVVRLNDDPVGNGVRQYLPRLSMAPGGRIDAVYLDRRHDPENADNDISYTYSRDGGATFAPARRLTSQSSSPHIGQRYAGAGAAGLVEIGSRLGLVSLRAGAVAAWPDTRYPALTPRRVGQDVFSTKIEFSTHQPGWPRLMAAALVAIGVFTAAGALAARRRRSRAQAAVGQVGPATIDSHDRSTTASAEDETPDDGHEDQTADVESPADDVRVVTGSRPARRALLTGAVAAALGIVTWAVTGPGGGAPAADVSPQMVEVTMTEYRFDYQAPPQPGRTVFRFVNAGKGDHMGSLNLLDDDVPPIDAQLHGTERRPVASPVELPVSSPGHIQTFAVDLAPGQRYAFLCFLVDPPTKEVHALKGMNSEFRTAGTKRSPPATPPTTTPSSVPPPTSLPPPSSPSP